MSVFKEIQLSEKSADALQCVICLEFMTQPTLIKVCGHSFCQTCIMSVEKRQCPICNGRFTMDQLIINWALKKHIETCVIVSCPQEECEWFGPLEAYYSHELICPESVIECEFKFVGCNFKCKRKYAKQHMKTNQTRHLNFVLKARKANKLQVTAQIINPSSDSDNDSLDESNSDEPTWPLSSDSGSESES